MRIRVRLFALQRQQTGLREVSLEVPDGASVAGAWAALVAAHPVVSPATGSVRFARNGRYVDEAEPLEEGDEVAVIPPVSGGSGEDDRPGSGDGSPGEGPGPRPGAEAGGPRLRRLELHDAAFGPGLADELRTELADPADGAVVAFVGQTRESPGTPAPGQEADAERVRGRRVQGLDYEAFESMTLATFAAIADEIESRLGVRRIAIVHRTGDVPLGQASVIVVVAAPHREEAFAACRYAIEELKARAPIWKAERFEDGTVWIGAPPRTGPREPGTASDDEPSDAMG